MDIHYNYQAGEANEIPDLQHCIFKQLILSVDKISLSLACHLVQITTAPKKGWRQAVVKTYVLTPTLNTAFGLQKKIKTRKFAI